MAIGPIIRQMFGPYEKPVSEAYRSIFVNLDSFVTQIQKWAAASRILELGCGEGAVIERLVKAYPGADITGIDVSPRVGRLFQGDNSRVTFKQDTIKDFSSRNPASFDLLVICDILHHIPWELHEEILIDARKALKPGSHLVIKDWERNYSPIHFLCHFSDRFITADRVRYKSADELRVLIKQVFGADAIQAEARIRPRFNNIAFLVRV